MAKNRRKNPRIRPRALVAHLRTHGQMVVCQVENVSATGLFVRTDERHEPGERLEVDLVKPGWKKSVALSATVTTSVPPGPRTTPGIGLRFDEPDDETRLRFEDLLAQLGLPREPAPAAPEPMLLELAEDPGATDLVLRPIATTDDLDPYELQADARGRLVARTSTPRPVPPPHSPPAEAVQPAPPSQDVARLTMQIRGLLIELDEAKNQLSERDAELARLRELLATALGVPVDREA